MLSDVGGGLMLPNQALVIVWQHGPEVRYERALPARGFLLNAGVWLQGITTFRRYRSSQSLYAGSSLTPATRQWPRRRPPAGR